MAKLQSPGVSVSVIDESFYTPAAPGTVPLIVVASEESKPNGAGSGTAPGTLKANAGQVYLLTSQKDLSDTFGTPIFQTDASNNPIHAGELNEYGLQAAYSFLGVSNSAYVVRADLNLSQLAETTQIPAGLPANGTTWIDTTTTQFGVFQWNAAPASELGGQTFNVQKVAVITDTTLVSSNAPKLSFGAIGSYAIVATTNLLTLWFKKPATTDASPVQWIEVGTQEWVASWPTAQGSILQSVITLVDTGVNADTFTINSHSITGITTLAALVTAINTGGTNGAPIATGVSAAIIQNKLQIYSTGVSVVLSGSSVAKVGLTAGTYYAPALSIAPHTQVPTYKKTDNLSSVSGIPTGSIWIKTTTPNAGAHWIVNRYNSKSGVWDSVTAPLYKDNLSALNALDSTGGGNNLAANTLYVKYNDSEVLRTEHAVDYPGFADFKLYRRSAVGATTITSAIITSSTFSSTAIPAGSFVVDSVYKILTLGNTNWQNIGAPVGAVVGTIFTATGTGTSDLAAGTAAKVRRFTIAESTIGSSSLATPALVSFSVNPSDTGVTVAEAIASSINSAGFTNIVASINSANQLVISHLTGGDFKLVDGVQTPLSTLFSTASTANFYADPAGASVTYIASNWTSQNDAKTGSFSIPNPTAPSSLTANGTLWYDGNIDEVDILIHNGTTWKGYAQVDNGDGIGATDPLGPIISATEPTTQQDGASALANGDLWISTADLEKYPLIYKYDNTNKKWNLLDNSDQTTENGILFHDARWNTDGLTSGQASIVSLLSSDFLDFDAPDPALYPRGMLLWNLRRSGFNVKQFVQNYVNVLDTNTRFNNNEVMTNYYPHRWVSEAANQADGSGSFGRIAQRTVVLQAMTALINSNQQIRDEDSKLFNLIAAPGYPELIKPLVNLNYDRGLTAFVVGDTPARLTPDATTLSNWGSNINNALTDGDNGLVTTDAYLGVFYPWGYSTDNMGNNISVPPSHMMLRTIALSDNVSYPWFAPAGVRRGGITNASAVGYITAEGEFNSIALNNGQRDTLANIHVNPLTYISGTGLVNYGQKTRQLVASSLDRINVARLVIYLRVQLERIAKPYIFEPNDTQTRNEIKQQIESFLLELVGQRALYDFLVVCDTSNNTPSRIDANELYVDIAIEPVKAVEFIYIPLRLENTGAIAKLGQ